MNEIKYKTIKELESNNHGPARISQFLRDGWVILNIRVRRPNAGSKREFEDELIYTIGSTSIEH